MTYFEAKDIALIEHKIISESNILEWKPDDFLMYLSGIHDFAEELIKIIRGKEGGA